MDTIVAQFAKMDVREAEALVKKLSKILDLRKRLNNANDAKTSLENELADEIKGKEESYW